MKPQDATADRASVLLEPPRSIQLAGLIGLAAVLLLPILGALIVTDTRVEAVSYFLPSLEDHFVVSPADGVVESLLASEGESVAAGREIARILVEPESAKERVERTRRRAELDRAIVRAQSAIDRRLASLEVDATGAAEQRALSLLRAQKRDRETELALRRSAESRSRLAAQRGLISKDSLEAMSIERVAAERAVKDAEREILESERAMHERESFRLENYAVMTASQVEMLQQLQALREEAARAADATVTYEQEEIRTIVELVTTKGAWVKRGDPIARLVSHGPSRRLVALLEPGDAATLTEGMRVEVEVTGPDPLARATFPAVVAGDGAAWTTDGRFDLALSQGGSLKHRVALEAQQGNAFPVGTKARVFVNVGRSSLLKYLLFGAARSDAPAG